MSKKLTYSIQDRDEGLLITGLSRTAPDQWRVKEWLDLPAEETPSRGLSRDMGEESLHVTWRLDNHDVQLNTATLPDLKRKEMDRAVAGWIAREEKGAPEQFASAWKMLEGAPDEQEGETRNLVLMYAQNDVVQPRLERAAGWDVKPGRMLPSFMVLDSFFRLAGPRTDEFKVWNLVFLGKTANFLCVAIDECVVMTRPLLGDLSGGSDPDEYVERLTTEVTRSQFFARQTVGSPDVERIFVCGDDTLAPMLAEKLATTQDTPSEYWNLGDHFDVGDHPCDADGYLTLAAAALGGEPVPMNLLPEPRRGLLGAKAKRRVLGGAVVLAATITPLLWFAGTSITGIHEEYLSDARVQLRQSQREAKEAEAIYKEYRLLMERSDHVNAHLGREHRLDQLLLELAGLTPAQVTFQDLQITGSDDGMLLSIIGESRALTAEQAQQAFLDFMSALEGSDLLGYRGEPRQLEIDRPKEQASRMKRVVFSLDYDLMSPVEKQEG
jgi:hypothetical protein